MRKLLGDLGEGGKERLGKSCIPTKLYNWGKTKVKLKKTKGNQDIENKIHQVNCWEIWILFKMINYVFVRKLFFYTLTS